MNARNAVEFLMAGYSCVGVFSVGILRGIDVVEHMCGDLSVLWDRLGIADIPSVRGAVLPHLLERDIVSELHFTFEPYANKRTDSRGCSNYRRCITVCSYSARTLDCPDMHVDPTLCRDCGVCTDVCPTGALRAEILPQTDDAKLRETK